MKTQFYEFNQNNSGGSFDIDANVTHRIFIEADSKEEATDKAIDLGVYFDGCSKGLDCSCCGDRWYGSEPVELEAWNEEGYPVSVYTSLHGDYKKEYQRKYGELTHIKEPELVKEYSFEKYVGRVIFKDVLEYAQFLANQYGSCKPDSYIYYCDGRKESVSKTIQ